MKLFKSLSLWQTATLAFAITGLMLGVLVSVLSIIQVRAQSASAPPPASVSRAVYSYPGDYSAPISHYYTYLIDTGGRAGIADAIHAEQQGRFTAWPSDRTTFNLGLNCTDVWLYIPVRNTGPRDVCLVWQLENTIDSAQLFLRSGDSVIAHPASHFRTSLAQRSLPVKAVFDTIWLHSGAYRDLYFHVFRTHYNTNIPMTLLPLSVFHQRDGRNTCIYVAYISVFAFIILFNLFLFISLGDTIHLWYSMFIFSISMMLLIDDYFPVLVFPDFLFRLFAVTEPLPFVDWGMVGSGMVMQLLLGQNRHNSLLWRPYRIILAIGFALGAVQLIAASLTLAGVTAYPFYFFHIISNLFMLASVFVGACCVMEKIIQGEVMARVYFCTTMLPILGILNSYLNSIGFTNFRFMFPTSVAVGIMVEIIVLTMLLTQRYNRLQKDKNLLLQQQLLMQRELSDRIAETQENEQKRIAEDLHDGIGSMLTALRMMVNKGIHYFKDSGQNEPAEVLSSVQQQVDRIVVDVRTISHNLMPRDFEQHEFDEIIRDHLIVVNSSYEINVEYYLDPLINDLPKNIQIGVFRIFTELLNNALKHSQTQNITTQFLLHGNTLMLTMEDEGIGFTVEKATAGIGLKNIHSRVRFLHGKISFDSSPKGTIIIVEIPVD